MTQFCTETTQIPFHSVQRPLLKSSWIWILLGVVRNEQQLLLNRSCLVQPVPMCCVLLGSLGDKISCPGALASAPASCGCLTSVCFITISWKVKVKAVQVCLTLCDPMNYSPWNSPGQNTGVGSLSFSRGSSQPRDRTRVFCIAGDFFTNWTIREAL